MEHSKHVLVVEDITEVAPTSLRSAMQVFALDEDDFSPYVFMMVKRKPKAADKPSAFAGRLTPEADLTWLLHRAAQQMRSMVDEEASRHGIDLRDYIVLSALGMQESLTQLELGQALGLDKTTLTFELDKLEKKGLVKRRVDPADRRARIPEATAAGRNLQAKVASAIASLEQKLLATFAAREQRSMRVMLCQLIGDDADNVKGSCI